jgi:hypothetical protein
VGYRIGNERSDDGNKARILYVTAGWLLQKLVHLSEGSSSGFTHVGACRAGPMCTDVIIPDVNRDHADVVNDDEDAPPPLPPVLDEVHERSVESDLLCFLTREWLLDLLRRPGDKREDGAQVRTTGYETGIIICCHHRSEYLWIYVDVSPTAI